MALLYFNDRLRIVDTNGHYSHIVRKQESGKVIGLDDGTIGYASSWSCAIYLLRSEHTAKTADITEKYAETPTYRIIRSLL